MWEGEEMTPNEKIEKYFKPKIKDISTRDKRTRVLNQPAQQRNYVEFIMSYVTRKEQISRWE